MKNKVGRRMKFYLGLGLAGVLLLQISSCKRPEEPEVKASFAQGEDVFSKKDPVPADKMAMEEGDGSEGMDPSPKAAPIPEFPFKRKIKDTKGREIDAEILGKMDGKIALWRLPGKKRFVLPLDKLSDEDQAFFEGVPEGKYVAEPEPHTVTAGRASHSKKGEWLDNFDKAKELAREKKLPIYLLFTADSFNPDCNNLEDKVLSSDAFKEFADESLIFVKIEYRGNVEGRSEAVKEFGIKSVPTFFILHHDGKLLGGKKGYRGENVEDYIELLKGFIGKGRNIIPGIPSD